jgi:DNA-binding HxlR family transcriptional regulator
LKIELSCGRLPAVSEFRYPQFCPLARATEVLGNRWSLLVLRELALGAQRFGDLKRRLAGISTSVLAERLASLEAAGVIETGVLPPPAGSHVYRLTPHGESLRPVLLALTRWGLRWLAPPEAGDHYEPDWLRLALPAFAAPSPSSARRFELATGGERVRFAGGPRGFHFLSDDAPVDLTLEGAPPDLLGVLTGQLGPRAARARGVRFAGDGSALAELRRLFQFDLPSRAQPGELS